MEQLKSMKSRSRKCRACRIELGMDQLGIRRCYNSSCTEFGLTAKGRWAQDPRFRVVRPRNKVG